MEQGKQTSFNGKVIYRWYVTLDRKDHKTIVTWAESEGDARIKAERRGYNVVSVTPAPHRI